MLFNAATEDVLSNCGWTANRECDIPDLLREMSPFALHDVAREFLSRFHGVEILVPIDGFPDVPGFVHFSPAHALRFINPEQDAALLASLANEPVFPVGTTSGHTVFIFMGTSGKSYLLDMDRELFAELAQTPKEMVEVLCDGRNGRVDSQVLVDGALSGHVIGEGNERKHWAVDRYTDLVEYLPCVSLSPARRPPTWRPMVKTVQQVISRGNTPKDCLDKILVTPGGLCMGNDGQMFVVSHCENSIYIREKAGFRLGTPPPGISNSLRTGECVPFTPPSNW